AAATTSGVATSQKSARGRPSVGIGTYTEDDWTATASSGEPAGPIARSEQPRRTASPAIASVSPVSPNQDTAITRSVAPTQPGNWYERTVTTGIGAPWPQTAASR